MEKKPNDRILAREVALKDSVSANLEGRALLIKGPKGEIKREFHRDISIKIDNGSIKLLATKYDQRNKKIIGSVESHIKNMVQGVVEPFKYKLKICSGHFPMNVAVTSGRLIIKNFLGEKVPREVVIPKESKVVVDGDHINVESVDKEVAGQVSAKIEQITRRPGFDTRVFQDGIYLIEKTGKESQ